MAGSEVWHLYAFSADDGQNQAAAEIAKLAGAPLSLDSFGTIDVSGLYYGVNSRFTLNPSNDPALRGRTQLDWVAERRPTQLLVNIGSNNRLDAMLCLRATADTDDAPPSHSATIACFSPRDHRRRASATITNRSSSTPGPDINTA